MKRAIVLFLLVFSRAEYARAQTAKISLSERLWIASKVYSSIQIYFAHWQAVPDLDLDAAYKKYVAQIATTDDRLAFDLATKEFMARLRNGHSHFDDDWLYETHGQPLGFFVRQLGGQSVGDRNVDCRPLGRRYHPDDRQQDHRRIRNGEREMHRGFERQWPPKMATVAALC